MPWRYRVIARSSMPAHQQHRAEQPDPVLEREVLDRAPLRRRPAQPYEWPSLQFPFRPWAGAGSPVRPRLSREPLRDLRCRPLRLGMVRAYSTAETAGRPRRAAPRPLLLDNGRRSVAARTASCGCAGGARRLAVAGVRRLTIARRGRSGTSCRLPGRPQIADRRPALLALVLNLLAVLLLSRPLGALLRRFRPDLPRVVARDYAGTVVVAAVTASLTARRADPSRRAIDASQRAMQDAIARAQAWIGDRAPDEFRRNLQFVSTARRSRRARSTARACPSTDSRIATAAYCVIVDTARAAVRRGSVEVRRATSPNSVMFARRRGLGLIDDGPRTARRAPAIAARPGHQRLLIASILGSGIVFLDTTVVNVALPAIRSSLHGSLADQQWVVEAYLLTLSSLLLVGGSLGDLLGRRRVFAVGLRRLRSCSLLCALAPSAPALIGARALQGVGRRAARAEHAGADRGPLRARTSARPRSGRGRHGQAWRP